LRGKTGRDDSTSPPAMAIIGAMSEDGSDKPDPIEDVRKGLGLLFRAAKGAIDQLPTQKVEDAVLSGAREVGRAIENVTEAIDKQFFNKGGSTSSASASSGSDADTPPEPKKDEPSKEEAKGPRVG